ncbi:hypothetical protein FRC12_014602 [Ceratobasidium sp. 428]|nr:hypothetical protein FRC12_014602 [Ceratobasidium sp. 428]
MATIYDRGAATYGGLLQQTYAAIIVGTVCLTLVETLRRVPRRRGRGKAARTDPSDTGETRELAPQDAEGIKALGSRENWTNAYLYMGRCWAAVPSPPHPKWPLAWIWQVLRTPDQVFLQLSGVDAAVYIRFLKACFYFTALHTCTTLVVILPIHYVLSPPDIKRSDITRASLTTLVSGLTGGGRDILWVHMVMLIWITVSWMLLLAWFVLGSLKNREYAARHAPAPAASSLLSPGQPSSPKLAQAPEDTSSFPAGAYTTGTIFPLQPEPAPIRPPTSNPDGARPDHSLRCRTVMVTNIPQNIREPKMLRWYFGRYLPEPLKPGEPDDGGNQTKSWKKIIPSRKGKVSVRTDVPKPHDGKLHKINPAVSKGLPLNPDSQEDAAIREFEMTKEDVKWVNKRGEDLIENIILAPKLSGLADLIQRREKEMEELEAAHILLAKAVMGGVAKEMARRAKEESRNYREGELSRRQRAREELRHKGVRNVTGDQDGGGWLGGFRDRLERAWWVVEILVWGKPDRSSETNELVSIIGPFVELAQTRDAEYGIGVWARGASAWIKLKLEDMRKGSSKEGKGGGNTGSPTDTGVKKRRGNSGESNETANIDSKLVSPAVSPTSPTSKPLAPSSLISPANGHVSPSQHKSSQSRKSRPLDNTIWTALHSLPSDTLQRFHPYNRQRSIFLYPLELVGLLNPSELPTIDLSFLRIKRLQKRIQEYKNRPLPDAKEKPKRKDDVGKDTEMNKDFPSSGDESPIGQPSEKRPTAIEPASSAFVTFKRWEDARRAARLLEHRPGKPLTCLVVMAPQTTDLDWERLVKGKFAAQFLRDWLVGAAVWAFQIFWIFPISFITGLVSIKSLEAVFPPLKGFFERNPNAQNLITGLIPTLLVAGLGILIPVILFAIGRKAQTEVTFSGLHNGILIRYYKWLILNIVIFFCIGLTSFRTFLLAFRQKIPDPFVVVSEAFPAAAPFYASWPSTPRKRKRGTQPRTIDYHYWTPNHLLAMHIVMIFAVLNPLVIPFALIYYSVANVVFRNQLLHVYARRFYEGNGKMITIRVLRYSMDGLALSHVVFMAFNLLNYNKARAGISGTMLGVTIILKIWATRVFKSRYARLEDAESARLCGHEEPFLAPGERSSNEETRPSTGAIPSDAPLPLDRIKTFKSPTAAMAPSTFTWKPPGIGTISHKYDAVHRARNEPIRPKRTGTSRSLSRLPSRSTSRSGSRAEILRPDSPGSSDEVSVLASTPTGRAALLPGQLGLLDFAQQLGQVPNNIIGYFTSKPSETALAEGENYLGDVRPHDLVVLQPPLTRASYECPYYHDQAPKAIWLPRDPSGPVDLDDTVLMYRLLLNLQGSGTADPATVKASVDDQTKRQSELKGQGEDRSPMATRDSEKSGIAIPMTQSPAETPGETSPNRSSSYSSRAARPSMLRVRTASADRLATGSSWGRRQSISEALEMTNLQAPKSHHPSHTLPVTLGETSAQGRGRRQSLLSVFHPQRGGGASEAPDSARPVSIYSTNTATEGGEPRAERRKGRLMPAEEIRKVLDRTVEAEEIRHKAQTSKDEADEQLDDRRVENEEVNGWNILKNLVFKRNTE